MRILRRRLQTLLALKDDDYKHHGCIIDMLDHGMATRLVDIIDKDTDSNTKSYGYMILKQLLTLLKRRSHMCYEMYKYKLTLILSDRLKSLFLRDEFH